MKQTYVIAVAAALIAAGTIVVGSSFSVISDWGLHSVLFWTGSVVQGIGLMFFFYATIIRKLVRSKHGHREVTHSPRDEARTQ